MHQDPARAPRPSPKIRGTFGQSDAPRWTDGSPTSTSRRGAPKVADGGNMENSRKVLSAEDRKHAEIHHRWIFTRACHYGRVRGLEAHERAEIRLSRGKRARKSG